MKRSRLHWALITGTAAAVGVGAALGMRALTELVDATLPDARGIASFNRPGTITLLSTNGKVIQKLGPATREKVKPGAMPPTVAEAFIAAEDRRFYQHDGVDGWGIARAIVTNAVNVAVTVVTEIDRRQTKAMSWTLTLPTSSTSGLVRPMKAKHFWRRWCTNMSELSAQRIKSSH